MQIFQRHSLCSFLILFFALVNDDDVSCCEKEEEKKLKYFWNEFKYKRWKKIDSLTTFARKEKKNSSFIFMLKCWAGFFFIIYFFRKMVCLKEVKGGISMMRSQLVFFWCKYYTRNKFYSSWDLTLFYQCSRKFGFSAFFKIFFIYLFIYLFSSQ